MDKEKSSAIYIVLISILICLGFIFAAGVRPTILSPVHLGNYSTVMNFTCNISEEPVIANATTDGYNVSVYYNSTGGNADSGNGTLLYTMTNASSAQIIFENTSVDISGLADGRNYNFTCHLDNGTDLMIESANITIDHSAPNVSSFNNATNNNNYSNGVDAPLLGINVTVDDLLINISAVYVNITFENGTYVNASLGNFTALSSEGPTFSANINISLFEDGKYNITVYANDSATKNGTGVGNLNNTERIFIKLDSTGPAPTFNTLDDSNYSGNMVLNVSLNDAVIGTGEVYFNITNGTGWQFNFTKSSDDGTSYNLTVNTVGFADGNYTITAFTNDTQVGNSNNTEKINITIDNTAPSSPTMTCTPTNVYSGATVTCTCAGSDGETIINETVYTASPSTSSTGTFIETCTVFDTAGNGASGTATYTVDQSGGSGGGGGGSSTTTSFYTKTVSRLEQEFSEIKTINEDLREKQRVRVKINDETHYVGVREVKTTSVTIEIASDPVQIILDVGEDAKVDVNGDGFYDVYVKLNSITNGYADLTIDYLHEEVPEPVSEDEEKSPVETSGEIIEPEVEEEANLTWLWITIIVVIVAVVGIIIWKKRSSM